MDSGTDRPRMTPGIEGRSGILVAYDDTDSARRAAAFAAERAAETGETVTVVHIGSAVSEADVRAAVEESFEGDGVVLEVAVLPSGGSDDANVSVASVLIDLIDANEFSMVAMGNERHGLFHGLTEASVTEALIEDQSIPILLVP